MFAYGRGRGRFLFFPKNFQRSESNCEMPSYNPMRTEMGNGSFEIQRKKSWVGKKFCQSESFWFSVSYNLMRTEMGNELFHP